jgi:copper chaperone
MQTERFRAQNVKCQGCAKTIREGLAPLEGVESVQVDVTTGEVTVTGQGLSREAVSAKLSALGYPAAD